MAAVPAGASPGISNAAEGSSRLLLAAARPSLAAVDQLLLLLLLSSLAIAEVLSLLMRPRLPLLLLLLLVVMTVPLLPVLLAAAASAGACLRPRLLPVPLQLLGLACSPLHCQDDHLARCSQAAGRQVTRSPYVGIKLHALEKDNCTQHNPHHWRAALQVLSEHQWDQCLPSGDAYQHARIRHPVCDQDQDTAESCLATQPSSSSPQPLAAACGCQSSSNMAQFSQ